MLLAETLYAYCILHYQANRLYETMKYANEADKLYKQIGSGLNRTSDAFATIAWLNGDYEKAISYYEEMRERYVLLGEKSWRTAVTGELGRVTLEKGDLDQAQAYFEEALATAHELQDQHQLALRLADMGNISYLKGNMNQYKQNLKEGLYIVKTLIPYIKIKFLLTALVTLYSSMPRASVHILGVLHSAEGDNELMIPPLEKRHYDRAEAYARETLGDTAFESAFEEGRKMSLDEGLDLALKIVEEME